MSFSYSYEWGGTMMKKRLLNFFAVSFFCALCCSWTPVAADDLQKALGLLKAKLLNLAEQLEERPFVSADALGLTYRNTLSGNGTFKGKNISYKIYDVNVAVKQGKNECGCGLHTMKNLIFMTKVLDAKTENKRKKAIEKMDDRDVFNHYVNGSKSSEDEGGVSNWVSIWSKGKVGSGHCPTFDNPPARYLDTINLRTAILNNNAFAPQGSKEVLNRAIMLGDIDKVSNNQDVWTSGIKELRECMKKKSHFVIPIHIYYSWKDGSETIHHWMAVVLRGFKNNILEIFVVESGTKGLGLKKHKQLVGWILYGLGITDSYFVQAPSPIRNNSNPCLTLNRPQHSKKIMQPHALKRSSQNISHGS